MRQRTRSGKFIGLVDRNEVVAAWNLGHEVDDLTVMFGRTREAIIKVLNKRGIRVRHGNPFKGKLPAPAKASINYNDPVVMANRVSARQAEMARAFELRGPDRTPCFKCGVRGDVGCIHTRIAA